MPPERAIRAFPRSLRGRLASAARSGAGRAARVPVLPTPGDRRTPPGAGCSGRAAPLRAGICAGRVVFFHWCGVAKCSGAAANMGWLGRNEGIVGQPGDVAPRFRTGALPALPSMMAGRAPATGARCYIPRSSSTDFGADSIDFSAAASRPGPCELLRPRPLTPDSRPFRGCPAPGFGRFPSRPRPAS